MKKILVTGAAGFLGANLVKRLKEDPENQINILIHKDKWHPFLDDLDLNIFYGDIRNREDLEKAMFGCDFVYQIAGVVSYNKKDNEYVYSTHIDGVRNILEVSSKFGVKKVVVTASTAGIGIPEDKDKPLNEENVLDFKKYKNNAYMYSKHRTIELCKNFSKENDLDVCIISPTTIYGPGDITMHTGKIIKKIKEGKIKYAPPGGNAVVSVEDVVDAQILVMDKGVSGNNYILSNEFITYFDMFNLIADILKVEKIEKSMPFWILHPIKFILSIVENIYLIFDKKPLVSPTSINFTFKFRYFDSSKIRKELGWSPKVSFKKSIENSIDFYNKNNLL